MSAPKPTQLKILTENPGNHPLNLNEPKPRIILPELPAFLNKYAKEEWKRIAVALNRIGILSEIDVAALAAYCRPMEMGTSRRRFS